MKITIIGAGGNIGQRIAKEAVTRNHELTLITSKPMDFFGFENTKRIQIKSGDVFRTTELTELVKDSDVIISAYAPPKDNMEILSDASKNLIEVAKNAQSRLIVVGGAGTLYVNDTMQMLETPNFPDMFKGIALAHKTAMESSYHKETELDWTIVSPSPFLFAGERTNKFRVGNTKLLVDKAGKSSISMEDFAVGILDEVDNKNFIKKQFTLGY